jgi:hypothetical protein
MCCGADSPDPTPAGIVKAGWSWQNLRFCQAADYGEARRFVQAVSVSLLRKCCTKLQAAPHQDGALIVPEPQDLVRIGENRGLILLSSTLIIWHATCEMGLASD